MDDVEDQETQFQEMDAHQLAAQTAWVRLLIRELRKRGYNTIEDVVALLDEPGMTAEAAVERILSSKGPKPNQAAKKKGCRVAIFSAACQRADGWMPIQDARLILFAGQ